MYIRIANKTDYPELIDLMNRLAPAMLKSGNLQWKEKHPTKKAIKKDIEAHNLFILILDEKIIGVVVIDALLPDEYEQIPWKTSPNTYTFHRMMVDPKHQGKGIAKTMLHFIENRGINMGMKSLRADTHKDNTIMLSLFEKFNFSYVGNVYFGKEKSDFLCYEKTLF